MIPLEQLAPPFRMRQLLLSRRLSAMAPGDYAVVVLTRLETRVAATLLIPTLMRAMLLAARLVLPRMQPRTILEDALEVKVTAPLPRLVVPLTLRDPPVMMELVPESRLKVKTPVRFLTYSVRVLRLTRVRLTLLDRTVVTLVGLVLNREGLMATLILLKQFRLTVVHRAVVEFRPGTKVMCRAIGLQEVAVVEEVVLAAVVAELELL